MIELETPDFHLSLARSSQRTLRCEKRSFLGRLVVVESDGAFEYRSNDVREAEITGRGAGSHQQESFIDRAVRLDTLPCACAISALRPDPLGSCILGPPEITVLTHVPRAEVWGPKMRRTYTLHTR